MTERDLFDSEQAESIQDHLDAIARSKMPDPGAAILDYHDALAWLMRYEEKATRVELPDYIPADEWLAFVRSRRAMGKPMTKRAMKMKFRTLRNYAEQGQDIAKMLQRAADNGWQNFYPDERPNDAIAHGEFPA